MPAVALKKDLTTCPAHKKGEIIDGEKSVFACFKPVARKDDKIRCKDGTIDRIIEGDKSVLIGWKPAACKGHKTEHGGVIESGCPRVLIGQGLKNICKKNATQRGAALIQYSPKKPVPFIKPTKD